MVSFFSFIYGEMKPESNVQELLSMRFVWIALTQIEFGMSFAFVLATILIKNYVITQWVNVVHSAKATFLVNAPHSLDDTVFVEVLKNVFFVRVVYHIKRSSNIEHQIDQRMFAAKSKLKWMHPEIGMAITFP